MTASPVPALLRAVPELPAAADQVEQPVQFPFTLAAQTIYESGTREWHEARLAGVCGSEMAAVLGLSKWRTALQVFQVKRRLVDPMKQPVSDAAYFGTELEPVVRKVYRLRQRMHVARLPMLRHPKHDFMLGNLDGIARPLPDSLVPPGMRVAEFKTSRSDEGWGEAGSDVIPLDYRIQVMFYLAVTGLRLADVAVLIGGSDYRVYTIEVDPEMVEMIIDAAHEFWQRVLNDDPPEPVDIDDARRRWPAREAAGIVIATEKDLQTLETLKENQQLLKELELSVDEQKLRLMTAMGSATELRHSRTDKLLATWKPQAGAVRIDIERLRAERPEVAAQFSITGEPVRKFLTKH